MSGGTIYRHALGVLLNSALSEPARSLVVAALDANHEGAQFLYQAGSDAGLQRSDVLNRGAAILFSSAAIQVMDDVSDGDREYLVGLVRNGPTAELVLLQMGNILIAQQNVPAHITERIARGLIACGEAQFLDVDTTLWTLPTAKSLAVGFAGQVEAYLHLLWFGTRFEGFSQHVGRNLGVAVHVGKDIASADRRVTSLSCEDRRNLARWALDGLTELEPYQIPSVEMLSRSVARPLVQVVQ